LQNFQRIAHSNPCAKPIAKPFPKPRGLLVQQAQAVAKQQTDFLAGLAATAAEQDKAVQRVRATGQLLGSCQTTKFLPVQKRAAEAIKVTLFNLPYKSLRFVRLIHSIVP
jgi:hypothetical protein